MKLPIDLYAKTSTRFEERVEGVVVAVYFILFFLVLGGWA